jgi:hypothetical protein
MVNFLKPNFWKIVLTFILFFVSSAIWQVYVLSNISDTFPAGFPFEFFIAWGPCPPGENCSEFNALFLFLDLIIWYVVSALIVGRVLKRT